MLCVDLIGRYQFTPKREGKKYLNKPKKDDEKYKMTTTLGKSSFLQAVTMIDPATGWLEIKAVPWAHADLVAYPVELAWPNRNSLPTKVIVDSGKVVMAEFNSMIDKGYSIEVRSFTTRNPQAW